MSLSLHSIEMGVITLGVIITSIKPAKELWVPIRNWLDRKRIHKELTK